MTLIVWNESMSVGVPEMDEDHRQLVALLNLADAILKAGKQEDAVAILNRLLEETKLHFQREEKLLDEIGFEGAEEHRQEHDHVLQTALQWQAHFHGGADLTLDNLTKFQTWFDAHVHGADMQYGAFLKSKEKSLSH